jgi:glycosyltransferase involved in cell wall biosynthesis
MRILVLAAYCEPEIAASLYLYSNVYDAIAKLGHQVLVLTPTPTRGIDDSIRRNYKKSKEEVGFEGNLLIRRFWLPREGKNNLHRFLRYVLLCFVLSWKALWIKTDVIFAASTPPIIGLVGSVLRSIKRCRFVYNIQDLFPESLVSTGVIKEDSKIYKIGSLVQRIIYKNTDKIITISESFRYRIMATGVSSHKVYVIQNWAETDRIFPISRKENVLCDRYQLPRNKFLVTYCGNMGLSQNLEMLLEVAVEFTSFEDIHFVLIGDGACRPSLEKLINGNTFNNITLLPFQPYDDIAHVFSLGDISLVLSKANVGASAVPSKTWSIMAAARPLLASFDLDSDLCSMINGAECGVCVRAEDKNAFKDALINLYASRDILSEMGENGRKYVLEHCSSTTNPGRYAEIIIGSVQRKK